MKPLRVLVVVALVAVIAGVLGTPWMQVVEEHTRTENVVYTLPLGYTYTGQVTSSTEILSGILDLKAGGYYWIPTGYPPLLRPLRYLTLTEGELVEIKVQATPEIPAGSLSASLIREVNGTVNLPTPVCGFTYNGTDTMEYGAACILESGQPAKCEAGCRIPNSGNYILTLTTHDDVTIDLRLLVLDVNASPVVTTSEFTTTWYNTTYKRPLG